MAQRFAPWGSALAVAALVGAGFVLAPGEDEAADATYVPDRSLGTVTRPIEELEQFSRSLAEERPVPATPGQPEDGRGADGTIEPTTTGHRFLTEELNFWSGPGEGYELLDVLATGRRVAVTGQESGGYTQVLLDDQVGWVNSSYLSEDKPVAPDDTEADDGGSTGSESPSVSGGISSAPCPSGSAVEEGLTPDAIRVHRGVCAAFPEISSYGGLRSDGEHSEGRALDIMTSDPATGDAIAEWVRANHAALGVSEILWAQRIWTVQRSSEGWRTFEDRGSATANHYDHVHVTVYGDSGG
ncbi:MAG: SH3 domain-containing protein [Nocardioidaceae bacterium]